MAAIEQTGGSRRDPRVDLLRGAALLMIFIDHVPGNVLGDFTLRNFGFSDSAEVFVIMAGFSAMAAYGRVFAERGYRAGLMKVLGRCLRLYGTQLLLVMITLIVVLAWTRSAGYEALIVGPMLRDGVHGAMRGIILEALPAYLDILPLYLILLAGFPLVYVGLKRSPRVTLLLSGLIYLAANLWQINLLNRVDRAKSTEWIFNPFAWQLIFVIGAVFAIFAMRPAGLPRSNRLIVLCRLYLLFALVMVAPWQLWPNGWISLLGPLSFGNDPKVYLSPMRLLDALAMIYLAMHSERLRRWSQSLAAAPLMQCGRHSLEIFAAGTVLSLFGRLAFRTWGTGPALQVMINVVGLGILLALAYLLDKKPFHTRTGSRPPAPAQLDTVFRRTA